MSDPNSSSSSLTPSTEADIEVLGGADAVEKTTYVTGQGTSPEGSNRGQIPPVSQSLLGTPTLWITLIVALAIMVVYGLGFLGSHSHP